MTMSCILAKTPTITMACILAMTMTFILTVTYILVISGHNVSCKLMVKSFLDDVGRDVDQLTVELSIFFRVETQVLNNGSRKLNNLKGKFSSRCLYSAVSLFLNSSPPPCSKGFGNEEGNQ